MRLFSVEKQRNGKVDERRRVKVGIAIPCHSMIPQQFMCDISALTEHVATGTANVAKNPRSGMLEQFTIKDGKLIWLHEPPIETQFYVMAGTYVHTARNRLLMRMIEDNCTHMLWIDSDMRFPPNALQQLLQRDVNMVGINYTTRGLPPRYVAIKRISTADDLDGELCETHEDSTGIEEVEALGFGMVLMKASLFNNMDFSSPMFWYEMIGDTVHHIGEDVYFCKKVRAAGEKIYVDHDLSKQCKHVGLCEYELGMIWAANSPELAGV